MKRASLLFCFLTLAAPVVAVAADRPGPPQRPGAAVRTDVPPALAIAAELCARELKQLGEAAFRAKYPTRGACLQAHADQAAEMVASCKSATDPKACVRAAIGGSTGETRRPGQQPQNDNATRLVPAVAAALCRAEYKALGADGFKQKYGTPTGCLQQMKAKATEIVQDAQAQCATAQDKQNCVRAAIATALGLPAPTPAHS